jgi:hypothetical protein
LGWLARGWPEPTTQINSSLFRGKFVIVMEVGVTEPEKEGVLQELVVLPNAWPYPRKSDVKVTLKVSALEIVLSVPFAFRTGVMSPAVVWACPATAAYTAVKLSLLPFINSVPCTAGSVNSIAPTVINDMPGALAKAGKERGDKSVPGACMVTGKALASGVTVPSAIAPATPNVPNEIMSPIWAEAVTTENVAEFAPTPPPASVKVEVPVLVSVGVEPKVKPDGSVTTMLEPVLSVEVAWYVTRPAGTLSAPDV